MSIVFVTKDLLFSSRVTSVATQRSIELSVLADADELVERASTIPVKVILLDLGTSWGIVEVTVRIGGFIINGRGNTIFQHAQYGEGGFHTTSRPE